MEAKRTRADALGALLITVVVEMAFFAGYQSFVWYGTDTDFWWHLAIGRDVATIGAIPSVDTYSFTAPLHLWVAHSWLVDYLFYRLYSAFGMTGPLVVAGAVDALTIGTTAWLARRLGATRIASASLALVVLILLFRFAYPRPQLLGFALFGLELALLERWIAARDRSIYALPIVVALWANLHASFVLGVALPIGYVAAEAIARGLDLPRRGTLDRAGVVTLAKATTLALVAPWLTPHGARLVAYVLSKVSQPGRKEHLLEWQATDITSPVGKLFSLLVALAVTLIVLRRRPLLLRDIGLLVVAVVAGLSCIRYVPFASILLVALVARALGTGDVSLPDVEGRPMPILTRLRDHLRGPGPSGVPLSAGLVALVAALAYGFDPRPRYREEADPDIPFAAVHLLGNRLLAGRTLNDFEWGGYLIYRLGPQGKVFIDTRSDHFIETGVFEDYFAAVLVGRRVDDVFAKYAIDHLFLRRSAPLVRYALASGRCRVDNEDAQSVFLDCTKGR